MKNISKLTTILMMLLLCVFFVSCSDDDNDSGSNSLLVGKWTNGWHHEIYNKDGTYVYMTSIDENGVAHEVFATGTYVFDEKKMLLIWHFSNGNSRTAVVNMLNETTLSYTELDDGEVETFRRITD